MKNASNNFETVTTVVGIILFFLTAIFFVQACHTRDVTMLTIVATLIAVHGIAVRNVVIEKSWLNKSAADKWERHSALVGCFVLTIAALLHTSAGVDGVC